MEHFDAAIAGAGIIGLATALDLASAGLRVAVFERGLAMRESSWAAAGMLAAADPENPVALRPLSQLSINLYPEFLARVEQLSGGKVPIRTTRTLQGAHLPPPQTETLSGDALRAIVPGLESANLRFFFLDESSLDPRDLVRTLPSAAQAAGVVIHEQTAVMAVTPQPGCVRIQTARGEFSADNFINACGAWAADLADVPVAPRKGHILLVESPEPLAVTLRTPHLYLVPRGDGRIVIGATVEDAGFDKDIDPAAIDALYKAAANLWSPIRDARILDRWSGLRPASPDDLPIIGAGGENSHIRTRSWLSLGHFRNGILLAPGTARLLRRMILGEPSDIDASAYSAARFAASAAR